MIRIVPRGLAILLCVLHGPSAQADQADVIVMGATPGGIAAAVAAGRTGRPVTLVAYHNHVGGMMASGLGKSDIENRAMIGGLFKEFTEHVLAHYVNTYGKNHENVALCHDGYYFEPSVAESVFESMLLRALPLVR
jgi:monoamine oxidase